MLLRRLATDMSTTCPGADTPGDNACGIQQGHATEYASLPLFLFLLLREYGTWLGGMQDEERVMASNTQALDEMSRYGEGKSSYP